MSQTTSWRHVLVLFLAGVIVSIQIGKVPGAIPVLKSELSLGLVAAGWVVAIFSLIAATAGVGLGALAARVGHARLALGGMALTAAASLAGAFSHGQAQLLVARVFEGLGFIATVVSVPLLITAVTSRRDRNVAMGLWAAYMPLGTGSMLLIGAPLLEFIGWRGLWILTAAIIAVVALFVRVSAREATARMGAPEKPRLAEIVSVARRPGPLLLSLIFGLYAGQHVTLIGFLPLMLVEQNGLSKPLAAALVAAMVLSNALGNAVAGVALRHGIAPRATLLAGSLAMGLTALLVYPELPAVWRIIGGFVFCHVGGLVPGSLFALSPDHAPRIQQLSGINGLMLQGSAIGQLLMPPAIASLVALSANWSVGGVAGFVFMGMAAAAAVMLTRLSLPGGAGTAPENA